MYDLCFWSCCNTCPMQYNYNCNTIEIQMTIQLQYNCNTMPRNTQTLSKPLNGLRRGQISKCPTFEPRLLPIASQQPLRYANVQHRSYFHFAGFLIGSVQIIDIGARKAHLDYNRYMRHSRMHRHQKCDTIIRVQTIEHRNQVYLKSNASIDITHEYKRFHIEQMSVDNARSGKK